MKPVYPMVQRFSFLLFIVIAACLVDCSYPGRARESLSSHVEFGKASYYGNEFHGRKTSNGEIFDQNKLTAAHRTLPFGTVCRVTNLKNSKNVIVRINDRGPFIPGRIIDLSYKAADLLGGIRAGIMDVKVEVVK